MRSVVTLFNNEVRGSDFTDLIIHTSLYWLLAAFYWAVLV